MPLHPQAEQLLASIPPGKDTWEKTPEEARAALEANAALAGAATEVGAVVDITVPGPGGEIPVRVYSPRGSGPFGVVMHFHGGGWVTGSIDIYDLTCRDLVDTSGCMVASVGYRKAPEAKFPAAVEDCYAATDWFAQHADRFGGDGTRLAVAGSSAGGNLAAAVALMARDRGGPPISFQLLVYPAVVRDLASDSMRRYGDGYWITAKTAAWCWDHYLGDGAGEDPYAEPLKAPTLAGLPPALIINAECDPLADDGARYARALADAGVAVRHSVYFGMIHGFFIMRDVLDMGQEAMIEAGAALSWALRDRASRE